MKTTQPETREDLRKKREKNRDETDERKNGEERKRGRRDDDLS